MPRAGLAGLLAGAMALTLATPHTTSSAPAPPAAAAAATSSTALSTGAASSQAVATGKAVLATAMTTSTRQVTANPNGSFTMTVSPVPVRVERKGTWIGLDATLHANADGTVSPTAVPGALVLSDGGDKPLATMTSNGQQLSVTLPAALPKPTLSGDTATYANVLPGTDLVVTATAQGGFSDVFVVHSPAAARDPRLAALLKAHVGVSPGLSLRTDAAGELIAATAHGDNVFTAPPADAWDSSTTATATPTGAAAAGRGGTSAIKLIPTSTHSPLASTVASPGRYARQAGLGASLHDGTLTLTAPATLTDAAAASFPIFLDPAYGPAIANFATVNSGFTGQTYINGAGTQGYMQVGYNGDLEGCDPCFNARSFVTLNMSGLPAGATQISAEVNFWDSWSASCTGEELDLWTTGPIVTSGSNATTWSHQPTWISQIGSTTVAKGWSSSCPAGGVGYNISSAVQSVVNAHSSTLTLGLRIPASQESSNDDNWKQLNGNNTNQSVTTASVTYDVKPNKPTGLATSPATNCSTTTPTILGDTGVTLYAPVSTTTHANLTTTFDFYKTSAPATNLLTSTNGIASDTFTGASGKPAVMVLPEAFIKAQAGSTATSFTWKAETSDGDLTSDWSDTCTFTIDESRPGSPGIAVTPTASLPPGSSDCPLVPAAATMPVGTSCAFTITPPNGATISGYTYQVNDSEPELVNATGATTITFNLPGIVNTLTVSALSGGGNIGTSNTVWFDGTAFNPPETDGDLTADTTPDLIVPGNTTGDFPPGLWLAQGQRNGTVDSYAQNIGTSGLGFTNTASDWNGSQAVTGNFCGMGTQDVMAYFPGAYDQTSNPNGGGGAIVCGTGTTQPLQAPLNGEQYTIGQNSFSYTDTSDGTIYNASIIANGGTENDVDLDETVGLMYGIVPTGTNSGLLDVFAMTSPDLVGGSLALTLTTPTGGTDWNNWTIATAQDTRGGTSHTDMYLWDSATGDLYLWTGLGLNNTSFDQATGINVTSANTYQIAQNWNTGKSLTLRAADIAGTGNPSLWATNTATGQTTAYILPSISPNPPLTSTASSMTTATHSWQFTDMPDGDSGTAIATTTDGNGTMPMTPVASGADWNTGDQFSPDAAFTGNGGLQAANALNLSQSFTVSFWTKPQNNGETALSESGSAYPGLMLYPTASGWDYYLAKDNGTTEWGGDTITGGNVDFGVWTHIQATYNATTHVMSLYVDDTLVAAATHTPPTASATGPLTLGGNIANGVYTSWYNGQIADVQTWSGTPLAPNQPTTPASYHQAIDPERLLDTRLTNPSTNADSGAPQNGTPVAAYSTMTLQIVGDTVETPFNGGPANIPDSVTAVAIDVTVVGQTSNGNLSAYADGSQKPLTSSTNYPSNQTITGYQVVPVGLDGKIALYNYSAGTAQIVVDLNGYFTSDATLAGDQSYHPLTTADRIFDSRHNIVNTSLTAMGVVAANSTFTVTATGDGTVPAGASGLAINLTVTGQSGGGLLKAYEDGALAPKITSLTYSPATQVASLVADVSLSSAGKFDVANIGTSSADIIGDIQGYYTTDKTGEVYHTVNPTRLLDTRIGLGSPDGTTDIGAMTSNGTDILSDTAQITTATNPTLALMLTVANQTTGGQINAYPTGGTQPGTSNINWAGNQPTANMALIRTGTSGDITLLNTSTGTTDLIIDCNGYFASS